MLTLKGMCIKMAVDADGDTNEAKRYFVCIFLWLCTSPLVICEPRSAVIYIISYLSFHTVNINILLQSIIQWNDDILGL